MVNEPNEPQAFLDYLEVQNELQSQFQPLLEAPPMHPNCRCILSPRDLEWIDKRPLPVSEHFWDALHYYLQSN